MMMIWTVSQVHLSVSMTMMEHQFIFHFSRLEVPLLNTFIHFTEVPEEAYYIWNITKMRTFCTARSKDRFHGRSGLAAMKTWFIRHTHMTQFFYVLWCLYIQCIISTMHPVKWPSQTSTMPRKVSFPLPLTREHELSLRSSWQFPV